MANYNVQIQKTKGGEWTWAGVDPNIEATSYTAARRNMVRMSREPFWTDRIGAIAFRVRAVPDSGPIKPGPRQVAREALAKAERAEAELADEMRETAHLNKRLEEMRAQRDEAREAAQEMAGKLGLEVEW